MEPKPTHLKWRQTIKNQALGRGGFIDIEATDIHEQRAELYHKYAEVVAIYPFVLDLKARKSINKKLPLSELCDIAAAKGHRMSDPAILLGALLLRGFECTEAEDPSFNISSASSVLK